MDVVWLNAENDAEPVSFATRVVSALAEASRMRESNAREALKAAMQNFPLYRWSVVPVIGDRYVVKGTTRG